MAGHSLRRSYALTAGDAVRSLVVVRPLKFPGPLFSIVVAFLLAMLGAGVGLFAPNNTNANLSSVPTKMRALANGILGMMRHTGQSLSLAVSTALLGLYLFGQSPQLGGTFDPAKYIGALQVNFVLGAALASLGILVSLRNRKQSAWGSDSAPSGSSLGDDV